MQPGYGMPMGAGFHGPQRMVAPPAYSSQMAEEFKSKKQGYNYD